MFVHRENAKLCIFQCKQSQNCVASKIQYEKWPTWIAYAIANKIIKIASNSLKQSHVKKDRFNETATASNNVCHQ